MAVDLRLSSCGMSAWPRIFEFEALAPDIRSISAIKPSALARVIWNTMSADSQNGATRGKIFVICLAAVLLREGIVPFYVNCGVQGIPTHNWDFVLGREDGSAVVISANVAIRERWANENLAGWALKKQLDPASQAYIVIENVSEAAQLRRKIESGEAQFLDGSAQMFSSDFDHLIEILRNQNFVDSSNIINRGRADRLSGLGPIGV